MLPPGLQNHQGRCGSERPKGQPTQGLTQAAVTQAERRALIHVTQAAADQHQAQRRPAAVPGQPPHQQQSQHQRGGRPLGDTVPAAGEVHHGMGLAGGIHTRGGIKNIVAEVFPKQQQDGRQHKAPQLQPSQRARHPELPSSGDQHWHHGDGIHRPLDRCLPQTAPIGVTGCDSLRLRHGQDPFPQGEDPYI